MAITIYRLIPYAVLKSKIYGQLAESLVAMKPLSALCGSWVQHLRQGMLQALLLHIMQTTVPPVMLAQSVMNWCVRGLSFDPHIRMTQVVVLGKTV